MRRTVAIAVCLSSLAVLLAACGADEDGSGVQTIEVPADAETITEAVAQAGEGDLILISPGTYEEAVTVDVEGVELRGLDRNEVVLDGGDDAPNGITVAADDVTVRNLTVRRFTSNGVYATGVEGFYVGHVTAANNGLYGIYALSSRYVTITDSYASGHPDSGIYVGQCDPCDTLVTASTAERNAVGFLATNASRRMFVVSSTWRHNRVGVSISSQDAEYGAPQQDAEVVANLVQDNDDGDAPGAPTAGVGILVAGGQDDLISGNRVLGHDVGGIVVTDLPDGYVPNGTQVVGNDLANDGPDLVYALVAEARGDQPAPGGVCFAENTLSSSVPAGIQELLPCPDGADGGFSDDPSLFPEAVAGGRYQDEPLPPDQPGLDDAASAPRVTISRDELLRPEGAQVPAA